ncbi:MAG: GYF domain-containing protein [Planctomycetaceae bacterium]
MATLWHCRRLKSDLGPVGFHDLVKLVRAEQLAADDLVREEWNSEWRPAALAVGLFHMAGRQDLVDKWEAEQEELRRQEETARLAAEGAAAEENEAAWQKRLREVEAEREALEAAEREEREAELAANATSTEIDETLAAALAEIEEREKALQPTRWQRLWGAFANPETARLAFRWLPTLAVPNLIAWQILQWSEVEAQRFPDRQSLSSGMRNFPVWGECDSGMYFFLLFDVMLVGGIAAYCIARILESVADD